MQFDLAQRGNQAEKSEFESPRTFRQGATKNWRFRSFRLPIANSQLTCYRFRLE